MADQSEVVVQYLEVEHASLAMLEALGRLGWQPAALRWVEGEPRSEHDGDDDHASYHDGYSGLLVRFRPWREVARG